MKLTDNKKAILISLAAFLLPAIIMLFICYAEQFSPFGSVSILVADMKMQFVDYIGYMKSIFFGNNDFLYSFSKTFGGDMAGFASYYLFNPFFLILLFVPNEMLPAGITIMVIIMCGFAGLTFNLLLSEEYGYRLVSVIFSAAYALMGYYVAYVNCIHYFFSFIMFPLVIRGLIKVYKSEKYRVSYIAAVALCVCSNYYIGYMVLIFTAVFFVCMVIRDCETVKDVFTKIKAIWVVLSSTLLGVGISAFSLLSVVYSLKGQKSSGLLLALSRNFRLSEFFSGLYIDSFHGNLSDGLPIIYSGIIPVIFLFFYFVDKSISIKNKILAAFIFAFMLAGFWIDAINVAWHGFAHPIGFPYRNSFLFSFLVIYFGYKGFLSFKNGFKEIYICIFAVIYLAYSAYLIYIHSAYVSYKQVAVTGIFIALSFMCMYLLKSSRKYVVPSLVGIAVLQCLDLGYNGYYAIEAYYENNKYAAENSAEDFANYYNSLNDIISYIKGEDDSFYRIEKLYRRTHNDAMLLNYNGLSHFSSCETDSVKRFMGKLGYRDNGNWAFYSHGSTTFADSFMGMKYQINEYGDIAKPFTFIKYLNEKFIFVNPYALSLGFGMNSSVDNINMKETDPFIFQNEIVKSFNENNKEPYRQASIDSIELYNVVNDGNTYKIIDKDQEAYVEYQLTADSEDFIFMYFDAPEVQNADVYVNENWKEPYFTLYDWCIRECGHFAENEKVCVRFILQQDEIEIDNAYFYYEDKDAVAKWYESTKGNTCDINKITSSHLIADINVDDDTDRFVFTIPYEKDWNVTVDGNKVDTYSTMDALLSIDVNSGSHCVELRYIPRGLIIGSVISLMSLITTFCAIFMQKKRKNTSLKKS